jgi:hypothetical protein
MNRHRSDEMLHARSLPQLMPDSRRAEQTRRRCHALLARRSRRRARAVEFRTSFGRVAAPLLVAACGVLYAAALVATTFSLRDLLR